MPTAASEPSALAAWRRGIWRWRAAALRGAIAGVTDRSTDLSGLADALSPRVGLIQAQQVHGASIASLLGPALPTEPIGGCDGLVTVTPGAALVIRTADCLPMLLWDPVRRLAGALHAGWRGLAASLPTRAVARMAALGARPADLWVGIGPSIRSCCYEVGGDFEARLSPFIMQRASRRVCDLVACATAQLRAAGVPARRVLDSGLCTGCDLSRWFSVRKEGRETGRLLSFIMINP